MILKIALFEWSLNVIFVDGVISLCQKLGHLLG